MNWFLDTYQINIKIPKVSAPTLSAGFHWFFMHLQLKSYPKLAS